MQAEFIATGDGGEILATSDWVALRFSNGGAYPNGDRVTLYCRRSGIIRSVECHLPDLDFILQMSQATAMLFGSSIWPGGFIDLYPKNNGPLIFLSAGAEVQEAI